MADPTPYQPSYDFTAINKGPQLNTELANVQLSLTQTQDALADIRRDDGQLKNQIVTGDSLHPSVVTALQPLVDDRVEDAEAAAAAAQAAQVQAQTYAVNAGNYASVASDHATAAEAAADAAGDAEAGAAVDRAGAETARAGAETAQAATEAALSTKANVAHTHVPADITLPGAGVIGKTGGASSPGPATTLALATAATASTIPYRDAAGCVNVAPPTAAAHAATKAYSDGTIARAAVCFSAHKNATDQTGLVTATPTKLTFGTELFDIGAYYDAATSRFTPPANKYLLSARALVSAGTVDGRFCELHVYKNGAVHKTSSAHVSGTTDPLGVGVSCIVDANGTDYFEIWFTGYGVGNKTVSGAAASTWFEGHVI